MQLGDCIFFEGRVYRIARLDHNGLVVEISDGERRITVQPMNEHGKRVYSAIPGIYEEMGR